MSSLNQIETTTSSVRLNFFVNNTILSNRIDFHIQFIVDTMKEDELRRYLFQIKSQPFYFSSYFSTCLCVDVCPF
jgi:hypothetical protein